MRTSKTGWRVVASGVLALLLAAAGFDENFEGWFIGLLAAFGFGAIVVGRRL